MDGNKGKDVEMERECQVRSERMCFWVWSVQSWSLELNEGCMWETRLSHIDANAN